MIVIDQIREACVQRIKDAEIPGVGDNVLNSPAGSLLPDQLPVVAVFGVSCDFSGEDTWPREYIGDLDLRVKTIVSATTGADFVPSKLSAITEKIIEAIIYPWDSEIRAEGVGPVGPLGGLALDVVLTRIASLYGVESEREIGGEEIEFSIRFSQFLPGEEISDTLERVRVDFAGGVGSVEFDTE